ncbi:ESPR domain-containing protein [Actinobacillus equuli]|uniref:ESPR domain-containing protein n=1 Tax=Actinobacillus equuli TaxID=718 RepID=UPI003C6EC891
MGKIKYRGFSKQKKNEQHPPSHFFNKATQQYVVVSELAKSAGKVKAIFAGKYCFNFAQLF